MTRRPQLSAGKKALFALVAFFGFFALLEAGLALAGVKPRLAFEDPYVGFARTIPLYVRQGDEYVLGPGKDGWFNEQRFPARKPAGAFRIFSVGGSTTFGRPYNDPHSFSGWLREFLPVADPSREWEVINAGGVSYASYRVAALMEELAEYEPDLFLIYSGHNEFLERRTYQGLIETPEIVASAGGLLSRTRIYAAGARLLAPPAKPRPDQELLAEEVDTILAHSVGPSDYRRDDEWRSQVLAHYRFNLRRMVEIARAADAAAVLVTTASNWKDCSPFKNESTPGLSAEQVAQAARLREQGVEDRTDGRLDASLAALEESLALDPRYAETHYERGRTLLELGRAGEAKAAFERALVEDVCPLRSYPEMNEIVRETARATGAPLIDFAAYVDRNEPDGIPGAAQFLDHVHMNLDGYRALALLMVDELERTGRLKKSPGWNDASIAAARERVEARLDPATQAKALKNLARVFGWAGKMDEAARLAQQSLEQSGVDADAFNTLGRTAAAAGRRDEAMDWFRRALEVDPNHPDANTNYGAALTEGGRIEEAIPYFEAAIRANPRFVWAHLGMGQALSDLGDIEGAERHARTAVRIDPYSWEAQNNLGAELLALGRPAEALEHLKRATNLKPDYAAAFSNLGEALTRTGRLAEAEVELRRSLALDPAIAATHLNLGVALQESGRLEEAVEAYAEALEIEPTLSAALNNRAVALLALGRDEEAIADLRRALEVDPEFARANPEIRAILGE